MGLDKVKDLQEWAEGSMLKVCAKVMNEGRTHHTVKNITLAYGPLFILPIYQTCAWKWCFSIVSVCFCMCVNTILSRHLLISALEDFDCKVVPLN